MSRLNNTHIDDWENEPNRFLKIEQDAINSLLNQYVQFLCQRERIAESMLGSNEVYPKMLYEVEKDIEEVRLILNTFLLDKHSD